MTDAEAVDILDDNFTVIDTHGHFSDEEVEEARQLAIKALQSKRNMTNEAMCQQLIHMEAENERLHDALERLKQESCEDIISRKALYEALYEHFHDEDAPNNITEVTLGSVRNFVKDFSSVTPASSKMEQVEDAISKAGVIKLIDKHTNNDGTLDDDITCILEELPPIQPKAKVGKWIESHIPESVLSECSECGFSCGAYSFKYCPMCGAKMESEE